MRKRIFYVFSYAFFIKQRKIGIYLTCYSVNTGTIDIKYNEPATEINLKNCIENSGFKIVYE